MTIYDGQIYRSGEEIPDLGSWECISSGAGKRTYWGLSEDVEKLPTYCPSGSKALCLDTGEVYLWHAGLKQWYKFGGSSADNASVLGAAVLGSMILGQ